MREEIKVPQQQQQLELEVEGFFFFLGGGERGNFWCGGKQIFIIPTHSYL
jgi:hypothetical protein